MTTAGSPSVEYPELGAALARFPLGHRTISEMVLSVLREAIVTGVLAPGERLRQDSLAEVLNVSRVPVRSSLMQLEAEGLVTFTPGRGATVRALTEGQVVEIYALRSLLEAHALRQAMEHMTPERLARLAELADAVDHGAEGAEFRASRSEFCAVLYDSDSHPELCRTIDGLRASVGRYLLGLRLSHGPSHRHSDLVQLIGSGDQDGALSWLERHLSTVRDAVVDRVRSGATGAGATGAGASGTFASPRPLFPRNPQGAS